MNSGILRHVAVSAAAALSLTALAVTAIPTTPASAESTITLSPASGPVGTSVTVTSTQEFAFLPEATTVAFTPSDPPVIVDVLVNAPGDQTGTFTVPAGLAAGNYTLSFDASGASRGSATFEVTGAGTEYFVASLPGGYVGNPYSKSVAGADAASGGEYQFSLSESSGPLPPGLTLDSSGAISGTPTVPGTYTFTVEYLGAASTVKEFTITIGGVCSVTATSSTIDIGASTVISTDATGFNFAVATLTAPTDFASLTGVSHDFTNGSVSVIGSADISTLTSGASNTGVLLVYVVVLDDGELTIGCATSVTVEEIADVPTLHVTPDNQPLSYGDAKPEYTYTVTDNDGNEVLDLDSDPTCTSTYTPTTPVADSPLAITCSGAEKEGFEVVYEPASVTIARAWVYVKPDDQTVTFGDPAPDSAFYTFTYVDDEGNTLELWFEEEPECSSAYTSSTWVLASVPISCVYPGEEGPLPQIETANYLVIATWLSGQLSIDKKVLYVVPGDKSLPYGSAAPGPSFYTFNYYEDDDYETLGSTDESLLTAPECSSDFTDETPVSESALTITCSGGLATNHEFNVDATAELTVTQATARAATYTGTTSVAPDGDVTLSSAIDPVTCTATPTYSLDADPTGGDLVPYPLTGPTVSTVGWAVGTYVVTVSYPADANCTAVSDNTSSITLGVLTRGSAFGGGWHNAAGGKSAFGFQVQTFPKTSTSPTTVKGQVAWAQRSSWRFKGTLATYTTSSGVGTATGTGRLQYWKNSGSGGNWIDATTSTATVTIKFTPTTPSTKKSGGSPGSFAIGFGGTRAPGAPTLPALGSLSTLTGGNIKVS